MKISKDEAIDFVILILRWYLAFYMIDYGIAKLTGDQFGIRPEMAAKPLKDIDSLYVAWFLFGQSKVFKIAVAFSQIAGSILILIPRTKLIGALVLLPILANIFLIDVCFTMNQFGFALPVRLAGMMMADIAILYHSRDKVIAAWTALTTRETSGKKYSWWIYLSLPILGFLTDFILAVAFHPFQMLANYLFNRFGLWPGF
jgi:uncharacterized membrane protein YphA (DoxX/SURF4 family)